LLAEQVIILTRLTLQRMQDSPLIPAGFARRATAQAVEADPFA
jgi:hypothetical protein